MAGTVGVLVLAWAGPSGAACIPKDLPSPAPKDPIARALALEGRCPGSAQEFGEVVKRLGGRLEPTMVNFTGFHNPAPAAFFLFEIVSAAGSPPASTLRIERGDLVFGHFTAASDDGRLVPNQSGLVIEAIAWDPDKEFYNFYELAGGTWFYRGDSKDILDDIALLHRQRSAGVRPFGARLRCSGCHTNGGLIQKEMVPPHNDWFTRARSLPLGPLKPDAFLRAKLADLVDARELSTLVAASARRLADSPGYRKVLATRSMPERLRPLFCAVEVNIESDPEPVDDGRPSVRIPSAFFADPRLATADIAVPRPHYDAALLALRSRLPDTPSRADADHGWLTPVKAHSDRVAVDALVEQGVVDGEFVADVLAVDFTNPVFSGSRCGLLKRVPVEGGPGFVARFQDALRAAGTPGATELLANLTEADRTAAFHQKRVAAFLASCQQRAATPAAVLEWSRLLAQRRVEVGASELSQNPRGHILEDPGRVVFPVIEPPAVAGRLALAPTCQVQ